MSRYPAVRVPGGAWDECPAYTASLDAAAALMPEGWWITSGNCAREAHASAGREDAGEHGENAVVEAFAPPGREAAARTAAALRARAEEAGDE
jgi:hypothetical protein